VRSDGIQCDRRCAAASIAVATSLATESSVGISSVVGIAIGAAIAVVVGVVLANVSPSGYERWTNGPLTPLADLLLILNVLGLLISLKVT